MSEQSDRELIERGRDYANQLADSTHIRHKGAELVGDLADALEARLPSTDEDDLTAINRIWDAYGIAPVERGRYMPEMLEAYRAGQASRLPRVVESEAEWEIPHCHTDEWGKVQHTINCECWGPSDRPKMRRHPAGPWEPVPTTDTPTREGQP